MAKFFPDTGSKMSGKSACWQNHRLVGNYVELTMSVERSTMEQLEQVMYRRPKFLEVLLKIRQDMARESDYDVDLFAEMVRAGKFTSVGNGFEMGVEHEESGKAKNLNSSDQDLWKSRLMQ
jgi:hypothetical protein